MNPREKPRSSQGPPALRIVLYAPRIPQNVGQIARTCYAMNLELHLIRPLGFRIDSAALQRAGVGYWDRLAPQVHADTEAFRAALPDDARVYLVTKHGRTAHTQGRFAPGDWLIFGNEDEGLPETWIEEQIDRTLVINMVNPAARCLNLATSVSVVAFEALRQIEATEAR